MPRKTTAAPTPVTEPADPLAEFREPDARYPEPEGPQAGQEGAGEPDPLADVVEAALGGVEASWRQSLGVETPADVAEYVAGIQESLVADLRPLVEPATATGLSLQESVDRWHADTVAMGFLHKGGRCGCHYIGRVLGLTDPAPDQD